MMEHLVLTWFNEFIFLVFSFGIGTMLIGHHFSYFQKLFSLS